MRPCSEYASNRRKMQKLDPRSEAYYRLQCRNDELHAQMTARDEETARRAVTEIQISRVLARV